MQSLFPQADSSGHATATPIVQFRAGKCTLSAVLPNGKHTVTCDPRAGKIALIKGNDGLLHFKWINGLTNKVEDDRIVFPGEYTFKKVKTGRENCTDRIYMLKYQTGTQRLMYWMQDKSNEKDEETVKKVNDFLLNPNAVVAEPAATGAATGAGAGAGAGSVVSPDEWMRMIGLNNQGAAASQPRSETGATRSATATSAQPEAPAPPAPFGNLDLSQILRTLAEGSGNPNAPPAPPAPPAANATNTPAATSTATANDNTSTAPNAADMAGTSAPGENNSGDQSEQGGEGGGSNDNNNNNMEE